MWRTKSKSRGRRRGRKRGHIMKKRIVSILLTFCLCLSLLPTTALAADPAEQFPGLTPGETYWFDLSGANIPGNKNGSLPDDSLHWVPFTYVGTVNAYVLKSRSVNDNTAKGDSANAAGSTDPSNPIGYTYDHSLFIADYNVTSTDWNNLNGRNLIFGTAYTSGGVDYTLRAPSAGSNGTASGGTPASNEWDAILDKANQSYQDNTVGYIKNWNGMESWGQDTKDGPDPEWNRATRGYITARSWLFALQLSPSVGFRPVLELPSSDTLGSDGLATVTLDLNGGKLGGSTDDIQIIVKNGAAFTAPASDGLTRPDGDTGDYFKWLGSDGNLYAPGDSVPAGVTTLTALWTPHTHSWATAWSKNETHHWHACTVDGCDVTNDADKNGYAAHTYDQEIATADYKASDATCTAKATYYKSCICGAKDTETFESGEVNASNHTFGAWIGEVPATCKTTGTKGHKDCTDCNKHFDTDGNEITDLTITVDPTNHVGTPGNWQTSADKHWKVYSCCSAKVEEGTHVYTDDADTDCNTCGYIRTVEPPAHTHCVCGGNTDVGEHTSHTDVTWTGVSSLAEITGSGSYYLTDDILMSSNLNITGTVNLCLNGHQIYTQSGVPYGTVKIQPGAALNVCDCSANESGLITTCRGSYAIENSGTLNLYSGSVERSSDDNEAAVKVNAGAVFHMYGGKIGGNAKAIIANGEVNVSGGTVSAKRQAMEVYAGSEVTVSGNAALSVTGSGYSTIAVYGGTVNIRGGKVTNDSGVAVYVPTGESTLNISGGVISTSPSAKKDTVRLVSDSAEVNVTGGSITNEYSSPTTSGSNIYGWAIGVYNVKSLTISGAPVINRIYLAENRSITVGESGLTNEAPIEIHCAKCPAPVTGANDKDYSSKFTPKSSLYAIINAKDNVVLFTKAATVTYTDGVDGEEIFPNQTHNTYLGQPTPAFNGTPLRTGYTFAGWYTDKDCTTEYDFSTPVAKDLTLYAKWTHTHSWAEEWTTDDTHHWHDCTAAGCGVTNNADKDGYAAHTYNQEIATDEYKASDATCTAKATYYKSCICGAKGTETFESGEVNASNHTFGDWIDEVPATCKTNGTKGHEDCTGCGKHFDASNNEIIDLTIPVDPANHTTGGWQSNRLYHWKVCTICDEIVYKTRHNYGTDRRCDTCDYVKPRRSNPTTPSQPTDTTTKSPDTGDMGIALYAGMALLSLTGGAWVVNKKRKGK